MTDGCSIPLDAQIAALLTGAVYDLVCKFVHHPSRYNLKQYITVGRADLVQFLSDHPEAAEAYLQNHSGEGPVHDVERIWREGAIFKVATMDHGRPRLVREFASLPEAVAEHVLVSYGMY